MSCFVLNLLFLIVITPSAALTDGSTMVAKDERFQVSVPSGWTVVSGKFHVSHYRYVQLCFNNVGDKKLRVKDWTEKTNGGFKSTYGPSAVSRQLSEGSVYVDIAKWDGPPSPMWSLAWSGLEGPESRITEFLENTPIHWETEELVAYQVSFVKWGWDWDIAIYCRKPFDKRCLADAFRIIDTLEFTEVPILTEGQAVEAAIPYLPEEAHPLPGPDACREYFQYDVSADRTDTGFLVTFTKLDSTNERRPLRSFTFLVSSDGSIEALDFGD